MLFAACSLPAFRLGPAGTGWHVTRSLCVTSVREIGWEDMPGACPNPSDPSPSQRARGALSLSLAARGGSARTPSHGKRRLLGAGASAPQVGRCSLRTTRTRRVSLSARSPAAPAAGAPPRAVHPARLPGFHRRPFDQVAPTLPIGGLGTRADGHGKSWVPSG